MAQQRIRRRKPDGSSKLLTFKEFGNDMVEAAVSEIRGLMAALGMSKSQVAVAGKNRKLAAEFADRCELVWDLVVGRGYSVVEYRSSDSSGWKATVVGMITKEEQKGTTIERVPIIWVPSLFSGNEAAEQMSRLLNRLRETPLRVLQLTEQPITITSQTKECSLRTLESSTIPAERLLAIYEKVRETLAQPRSQPAVE